MTLSNSAVSGGLYGETISPRSVPVSPTLGFGLVSHPPAAPPFCDAGITKILSLDWLAT